MRCIYLCAKPDTAECTIAACGLGNAVEPLINPRRLVAFIFACNKASYAVYTGLKHATGEGADVRNISKAKSAVQNSILGYVSLRRSGRHV